MCPSSRDEFAIAIISALPLKTEAVKDLFNKTYKRLGKYYRKQPGDNRFVDMADRLRQDPSKPIPNPNPTQSIMDNPWVPILV
ncbi:hypothetical protein BDV12DRAFT_178864 [Aspergillus spectabilis]